MSLRLVRFYFTQRRRTLTFNPFDPISCSSISRARDLIRRASRCFQETLAIKTTVDTLAQVSMSRLTKQQRLRWLASDLR